MELGLRAIACGVVLVVGVGACGAFGADSSTTTPSDDDGGPEGDGPLSSGDGAVTRADASFVDGGHTEGDAAGGFGAPCLKETACDRVVFVTEATYAADFGSAFTANAKCNDAAKNSPIAAVSARHFVAWVSDSTMGPIAARVARGTGKYLRVDRQVIAANWTDLTTKALQSPIEIDEGGAIALGPVWTGSAQSGDVPAGDPAVVSCSDWTATLTFEHGVAGVSGATDSTWSYLTTGTPCSALAHFYCFEE